jgi:hypothetical protein
MLRRFITSLVLLGFIVSQLAAMPHAHGADSPDDQHRHDAHPHIHIWFGGHSHARNIDLQEPPGLGDQRDTDDHDADAIFLPGAGAPALGNDRSQSAHQGDLASTGRIGLSAVCKANDKACKSLPWRPPDDDPPACPLFLKLRTIRI